VVNAVISREDLEHSKIAFDAAKDALTLSKHHLPLLWHLLIILIFIIIHN